ncbi:MAG: calcium/sodium antiporter [Proteobacteria bacterium]|nr:calcium/sodium antiporter [Pseudomonadota bacterium]
MNITLYLSSLIGLTLLCACANVLVDASISLANRLKLSKAFIGVVVIGFGSSLPEVFSVATASKQGFHDLAVSTVVGSNIANIGLLLGIALILTKSWPDMTKNRLDLLFIGTSYAVLLILSTFSDQITREQGIFMVSLLIFFVLLTIKIKSKDNTEPQEIEQPNNHYKTLKDQLFGILTGLTGITVGAHLLIEGAITIAHDFNIPEKVIGITMMALGTSLPETAASIVAAKKNESKMILGNVVGSNMFNILAALGLAAAVSPLKLGDFKLDGLFMLAMGILLIPFFLLKKGRTTPYGIALLIFYVIYVCVAIV